MKNCEYYEELIGAALDGEITAEEDKELRAHLESCEACRSFYKAMQAISGTDDALGDVPENFTANVMARVPTLPVCVLLWDSFSVRVP